MEISFIFLQKCCQFNENLRVPLIYCLMTNIVCDWLLKVPFVSVRYLQHLRQGILFVQYTIDRKKRKGVVPSIPPRHQQRPGMSAKL